MKFSLIVATLGRTAELERLLHSLEKQSHRDFEVIVVDQNPDDRLAGVMGAFAGRLQLRRITATPGLSHARNAGLRETTGEVVTFPDDDCWYGDQVLERANHLLSEHPDWGGVAGDAVDESGQRSLAGLPWRDAAGRLTPAMSWRHSLAYAYFIRADVLHRAGNFEETIGVGSKTPWQSGEDNDLMLRIVNLGTYVRYEPDLRVHHPKMFRSFDAEARSKRYKYSLGDGHLVRKHPMPLWWMSAFFGVPLAGAFVALLRLRSDEAAFYWRTLTGRMRGFLRD